MKKLPIVGSIPQKYRNLIREKAISRARTRIIVAGGNPAQFNADDLEVVVREEEDKIKGQFAQRGLIVVLALFGIHIFG